MGLDLQGPPQLGSLCSLSESRDDIRDDVLILGIKVELHAFFCGRRGECDRVGEGWKDDSKASVEQKENTRDQAPANGHQGVCHALSRASCWIEGWACWLRSLLKYTPTQEECHTDIHIVWQVDLTIL